MKVIVFPGTIPAGFPSPAGDYEESEIDLNQELGVGNPSVFIIRVEGDSMKGAYVPNGAYIVVDKGKMPKNNDIIVAVLNGEFTVKRLVKTMRGPELHPANPAFEPYPLQEFDEFSVWGVVTHVIIDREKVRL